MQLETKKRCGRLRATKLRSSSLHGLGEQPGPRELLQIRKHHSCWGPVGHHKCKEQTAELFQGKEEIQREGKATTTAGTSSWTLPVSMSGPWLRFVFFPVILQVQMEKGPEKQMCKRCQDTGCHKS